MNIPWLTKLLADSSSKLAGAKPRTALEIWSSAYVLLDPISFPGRVHESFFLLLLSSHPHSILLDCRPVRVGMWHAFGGSVRVQNGRSMFLL